MQKGVVVGSAFTRPDAVLVAVLDDDQGLSDFQGDRSFRELARGDDQRGGRALDEGAGVSVGRLVQILLGGGDAVDEGELVTAVGVVLGCGEGCRAPDIRPGESSAAVGPDKSPYKTSDCPASRLRQVRQRDLAIWTFRDVVIGGLS